LHNGLGRGAGLERTDHQFEEDTARADAKDSWRLLPERNGNSERLEIDGAHGIASLPQGLARTLLPPQRLGGCRTVAGHGKKKAKKRSGLVRLGFLNKSEALAL